MPENRPTIPADLKRRILVEAGHKCAVPTCGQTPVEIAHIVSWAKVRTHEFDNLIALCPTCHTRFDKGQIDRKSMRLYKAQLAAGEDYRSQMQQRVDRIESQVVQTQGESRFGFSSAVAYYRNRVCRIGFLDGKKFVTVGTTTFVRPRVAIVPGNVLDTIDNILKSRGDHAAVWEPSGMSKFQEICAPREDGDLRLIELEEAPDHARKHLLETRSPEEVEYLMVYFTVSESPVRAELGIHPGDHVGFLTDPHNTEDLRCTGEFQFQDAYVSFSGSPVKSGIHTGYLTPIPSAINYRGAPLFRTDGTLLAILTDFEFVESEIGGRPVFTTLLSLPELWRPRMTRQQPT